MSQEYIEVTGNTEQDAINNALIQLKVTIDNLDYSVIDHGSRGFLGFFNARPAKIRARKKVTAEVRPEVTKKAEAPVKEKKEPVKKAVEAATPAEPARKKAEKAEAPVKEKPVRKQKKEESEKKQAQKKEEPEKKAAAGQAAEESADNSEKKAKRENRNRGREFKVAKMSQLSYLTAFEIGLFQLLALIPGTSRSGATILGGMILGTSRKVSAEYSFFLSIPVMFGASLLKLVKFGWHFTAAEGLVLLTGMLTAFLVSIVSIRFLMGYIKRHDFKAFGWYRIVLGIIVIAYLFLVGDPTADK